MKHLVILSLSLFFAAFSNTLTAQCKSNSIFTASETIYLDSTNQEIRSVVESSVILVDDNGITITPGDDEVMKGKITVTECKWTIPFKDGKTVMKSSLSKGSGEAYAVTMTIEGKGGIITYLITIDDDPNKRIKLIGDKFAKE